MISARELAAWRAFAPWSSDVKVEQDYLLSKAVAAIFEDKFLSSPIAMRGGTVVHKGHLAPAGRYSEDIDLVRIGNRPASHLKKALMRVLHPLLGKPSGRDVRAEDAAEVNCGLGGAPGCRQPSSIEGRDNRRK